MWVSLGIAVVLLALIAAAALVLGDTEATELNAQTRAAMPEKSFVRLSDGFTHYEWQGPVDGPTVVLVHGFSSPMFIWDHNIAALAEAGFRVLRYDLYGRGLSDRPITRYTADLFDRQLGELLDALEVSGPIDLIGLSMGGAIALHFSDRHPERVRRIGLFAPVGFNELPPASRLMNVPGLGEWLIKAMGHRILMKGVRKQLGDDPEALRVFEEQYAMQLQYKGCKRALLSTMRYGPMEHLEGLYARVGRQPRPGILFWGTNDNVLPYGLHRPVLECFPSLQFHSINDGGHVANYQRADEVNRILIQFLAAS